MAASNMNNLTTLIKRLEAATSRLEDMTQPPADGVASTANGTAASGAAGGNTSATQRGPSTSTSTPQPPSQVLAPAIEDFDALINSQVTKFVNLSDELGGVVAEQSSGVLRAFGAQRKILIVSTRAKKPDVQSTAFMEILTELQTQMSAVGDVREANRASKFFSHLSAVSEGIGALAWITVEPKPADYIGEMFGGAQFYGNRVLKDYKDKDKSHIEWIQAFYQIFRSLSAYVKQHYPTGLVWNNKSGVDAKDALAQVDSRPSSARAPSTTGPSPTGGAGGPAPPPPPPLPKFDNPPPPPPKNDPPKSGSTGGDMNSVFAQLNQGEAVTSGLKKVDPSQMTHKNPSLRAGSPVMTPNDSQSSLSSTSRAKSPAPPPPGKKPKPDSMRTASATSTSTKRPPRKELEGNKWIIEHFDSPPTSSLPITIPVSLAHSLLITSCRNTTLRISGKANAISISNCSRLSLIIDSLVSSVDVVKSPHFALQVLGSVPTVVMDQVDQATLYLGRASVNTEILTSQCVGVNVCLPEGVVGRGAGEKMVDEGEEEGEFKEHPLPEQIKSFVRGGRVVSEIVEHAG